MKHVKIDPISGCWEWQASCYPAGYGAIKVNRHVIGAHRYAYMVFRGPIPRGLFVMHACDNRLCCNPAHLSLGTPRENVLDMMRKGRNRNANQRNDWSLRLLRDMSLSHQELADIMGCDRKTVRRKRRSIGIDRSAYGGGAQAWLRRKHNTLA